MLLCSSTACVAASPIVRSWGLSFPPPSHKSTPTPPPPAASALARHAGPQKGSRDGLVVARRRRNGPHQPPPPGGTRGGGRGAGPVRAARREGGAPAEAPTRRPVRGHAGEATRGASEVKKGRPVLLLSVPFVLLIVLGSRSLRDPCCGRIVSCSSSNEAPPAPPP